MLVGPGVAVGPGVLVGAGVAVGAGVEVGADVGAGVEPPPPLLLPPLTGFDVGLGVAVGDGIGVGHECDLRFGAVPLGHSVGVAAGVKASVPAVVGVRLAAADAPETPASMSANTPGSRANAARLRGRQGRVSLPITFAFIDVFQLWS